MNSSQILDASLINASRIKKNLCTSALVSPSMASSTPITKKQSNLMPRRGKSSLKQAVLQSQLETSDQNDSEKQSYFEALGLSQRADEKSMTTIPIDVVKSLGSFKSFEKSTIESPKRSGVLRNPKTRSPLKNAKVALTVLEDLKENRSGKVDREEKKRKRKKSDGGLEEKLRDLEKGLLISEGQPFERTSLRKESRKEERKEDSMSELRVVLQKLDPVNVNARKRKTVAWSQDETAVKRMKSGEDEDRLILKPGKHWRRSLSMLHNVHMGLDVNESVNKGSKWKSSLANIVQMQSRGFLIYKVFFKEVRVRFFRGTKTDECYL